MLIAKFILQTHQEDYPARPFPERPAVIALDDHELIEAHQSEVNGSKVTGDKKRALTYFGNWRYAVWESETNAGMRLLALVDAAQEFDRQNFGDEADVLFCFAEEHYPGFRRSDAPQGVMWSTLRDWCSTRVKNYSLLPKYMRTMERPKGGVPFHKPQGQRGGPDANREDQGAMPWDR